jgi:large subunit ribosomal protein L20
MIDGLGKAGVEVDRKVLSDLAIHEPAGFRGVGDQAKQALAYLSSDAGEFEHAVRQ